MSRVHFLLLFLGGHGILRGLTDHDNNVSESERQVECECESKRVRERVVLTRRGVLTRTLCKDVILTWIPILYKGPGVYNASHNSILWTCGNRLPLGIHIFYVTAIVVKVYEYKL